MSSAYLRVPKPFFLCKIAESFSSAWPQRGIGVLKKQASVEKFIARMPLLVSQEVIPLDLARLPVDAMFQNDYVGDCRDRQARDSGVRFGMRAVVS